CSLIVLAASYAASSKVGAKFAYIILVSPDAVGSANRSPTTPPSYVRVAARSIEPENARR
ncbi:MAG: hypothetical protein ACREH4_13430, partial [Vitreimonas sp.]